MSQFTAEIQPQSATSGSEPDGGCESNRPQQYRPQQHDVIQRVETTLEEIDAACRQVDDLAQVGFALSVIVPVFNERKTLPKILERIDANLLRRRYPGDLGAV